MIDQPARHRRAPAFAFVVLAFAASACVTTNMARTPANATPKPDEGIVVVSITGNTGQVGQIDYVNLRRENNPGKPENIQILTNVAKGLARDTALFVGIVPAGDYSLHQLSVGINYLSFGAGARQMIGDIRVEAGTIADLGRIVMTPINTRVLTGRSKLATSNQELIRKFSPENASILSQRIVPGWSTPHSSRDMVEDYALGRPVGADTPSELASGEVIAASRLGTLLIRNAQGRWRPVRTGALDALLAVHPTPAGQVDGLDAVAVAVGEFNTLVRLDSTEELHALDTGTLPPGNLVAIQGTPEAGWFIAHQQGAKLVLYHSMQLNAGNWQPVKTENIGFSFWSGANSFWMWQTDHGFAYAVSEGRIHRYDYASKSWTDLRAPGKSRLSAIAPTAKTIGILTSPGGGFGGIFASIYMSYDGGATWQELKSPYNVKLSAPRALEDGTLLLQGGGMYAKEEVQASTDRGVTWKVHSTNVGIHDNIVVLPTQGLLAINPGVTFGLASIRHSSDGGKTWKLEYSNINAGALEGGR